MPRLQGDIHDGGDRGGGEGGDPAGAAGGPDLIAEEWFKDDARRLGFLEPGGKGLAAYYRDVVGAQSPDTERRLKRREFTNFDFERMEEDPEC